MVRIAFDHQTPWHAPVVSLLRDEGVVVQFPEGSVGSVVDRWVISGQGRKEIDDIGKPRQGISMGPDPACLCWGGMYRKSGP